mgnify:CR=1 FL=1
MAGVGRANRYSLVVRSRDQIWAQAKKYYEAGEPWWVPKEEEALFAEEVSIYSDTADTEDLMSMVRAWFLSKPPQSRPQVTTLFKLIAEVVMIDLTSQRYAAVRKAMRTTLDLMGFKKLVRKGPISFATPHEIMTAPQSTSSTLLLEARRVDLESVAN